MSAAQLDSTGAALAEFRHVQRLAPNLKQPELRMLLALAGSKEGLTSTEIMACSGLTVESFGKRLASLVADGYIAGEPIAGAAKVFGKVSQRYRLVLPEGGAL